MCLGYSRSRTMPKDFNFVDPEFEYGSTDLNFGVYK